MKHSLSPQILNGIDYIKTDATTTKTIFNSQPTTHRSPNKAEDKTNSARTYNDIGVLMP